MIQLAICHTFSNSPRTKPMAFPVTLISSLPIGSASNAMTGLDLARTIKVVSHVPANAPTKLVIWLEMIHACHLAMLLADLTSISTSKLEHACRAATNHRNTHKLKKANYTV